MILEAILLLASIIAFLCLRLKHKQSTYWQKLGVKCPPVKFPRGNKTSMSFSGKNAVDVAREQYRLMKGEKYYGTFLLSEPCLVITDPDLIKNITVKDFNHFVDKRNAKSFGGTTRTDHIWRNQLSTTNGDTWKNTRSTFTPIFTSGKMKGMVCLIEEVNAKLMESFAKEVARGAEIDLKDKFGKFSMDTIASCAFGMDAQSFGNSDSLFIRHAKSIFHHNSKDFGKRILRMFPGGMSIMNLLSIPVAKPEPTMFFDEVIHNTLKERKNSKIRRNDLIDLMLDAMMDTSNNEQDLDEDKDDGYVRLSHKANKDKLDDIVIIATAMIMLIAGYDTTSQTLSYATYELAKNEDMQRRLQDEIDQVMENSHSKAPDYTTIQSMEYLDMVLHETLRLHPAIGSLDRMATEDYVIPGTNIRIDKGKRLLINVAGIHADESYYPEPEKFNPEHFGKEGKAARHLYAFLGFGQGPRHCIGMRFALLEAKIAMISLFGKYNVLKTEKTVEKVTLDPAAVLGASKEKLLVKFVDRY